MIKTEKLVKEWFNKWHIGDYLNLPLTENFKHNSPFGTINGKKAYLDLVRQNEEKFLGHTFEIHEGIYGTDKASVRYTASQSDNFSLDASEWYHIKDGLIEEIFSYYHIGDIRDDRKLETS